MKYSEMSSELLHKEDEEDIVVPKRRKAQHLVANNTFRRVTIEKTGISNNLVVNKSQILKQEDKIEAFLDFSKCNFGSV